jgi:hypothetical protein
LPPHKEQQPHHACGRVFAQWARASAYWLLDYGLYCPDRAKNLVWCFFQKYGSKNLKSVEDNLKLSQQALCTICLTDMTRRAHCTVKLGKDNSPSSMMDHLRIHHLVEFDAVAVANSQGLTLAAFNAQRKVNSEMGHDWKGCADHRLEKTVVSSGTTNH